LANCEGSIITSARCETTRTGYGPEPNERSSRETETTAANLLPKMFLDGPDS